jgi:ABC-2 type transport system ATP-binding protein
VTAAAPVASPALAAVGISKRYGKRQALRAVGLEAAPGEVVAVIGPNGAGKTTLLSILAGIQVPTAGSVSRPPREVGWVPQEPAVYAKLSVAENLRLFARLERIADPAAAVAAMLEQTGLAGRAGDELGRLSGGNRQRVNIAVGLLADPPVLLLDEPSSALDPRQRERLWEFVGGLAARGRAVVFRPTTSARPSATPTASWCWPTARPCSPGPRPSSSASPAATITTSRRPSCASCTSAATDRTARPEARCAGCSSRTCRSCAARRCWWRS